MLHPGEMGAALAAAAQAAGAEVGWASAGRSPATRVRASTLRLREALDSSLFEVQGRRYVIRVTACMSPGGLLRIDLTIADDVVKAGERAK